MSSTCCMCNAKASKTCIQCQSATYCGQECQRTDWKTHKILCKAFSSLPERPSEKHKLAILFPMEEDTPKLLWQPTVSVDNYDLVQFDDRLLGKYVGNNAYSILRISRNDRSGFNLPHWLILWFNDTPVVDSCKPNKALLKLGIPNPVYNFNGPFLATRTCSEDRNLEDITLSDFRHVVDHYLEHCKPPLIHLVNPGIPGNIEEAQRAGIALGAELILSEETRDFVLRAVRIAKNHPAFGAPISPVSQLLQYPIKVHKWDAPDRDVGPLPPPPIAFLCVDCNPLSPKWGHPPDDWFFGGMRALAVRPSGEDLDTALLKHMYSFAKDVLWPKLNASRKQTGRRGRKS